MLKTCRVPRLVVAAPGGRSGKTTVTVGLLAALKSKAVKVQPFKKGPDFIDPGWLTAITGRQCRNLDGFLMTRESIRDSFYRHTNGVDIGIVEGAMGLYDGVDLEGSGSTAEIAKAILAPVLLVLDTTRVTRSAAAVVLGFMRFDPEVRIAGVVLNKVARPRHEAMLKAAIEEYCGVPILGVIPKGKHFIIPDRHLGLITAGEFDDNGRNVEEIGKAAGECFDIGSLLKLAGSARPYKVEVREEIADTGEVEDKPVIGYFRDKAFSFYYPENIEALQSAGARVVKIDALYDTGLPEVDALYIGGGFPEVFAEEIEANGGLKEDLYSAVERGLPVYAECGGLMFLSRLLEWQGRTYKMSGALPFDVVMSDRPQGHGYMVVEVVKETPFFTRGVVVKGHEFHHSKVINIDESALEFAFRVIRGWGIDGERDGLVYKNVLATYNHIHALGNRGWAFEFVRRAREFRLGKNPSK